MNSKLQTPLEKLTAEKRRIWQETKEQEIKLNRQITYIQANAGSLFLSYLSSMLFSPNAKKTLPPPTGTTDGETNEASSANISVADFIPFAKLLLPAVWEIAKPILISWSIKRAGAVVAGLFSRKKQNNKF